MRQHTCAWNLKELGAALQHYENSVGTLPPIAEGKKLGMWIPLEGGETVTDPSTVPWIVKLLPHLDDEGVLRDIRGPGPESAGSFQCDVDVPRFRCPSDTYSSLENPYIGRYSRGNYAIDAGSNDICIRPGDSDHVCPNGAHMTRDAKTGTRTWYGDGIAGYNKSFRLDEFTNGMTHMVAIEEVRAGIHELDSRGVWALAMAGSSVTHQHGLYGDAGSPNKATHNADDIYGCKETTDALGAQQMIIEKMPCAAHLNRPRQAAARSMHPGGVYCLMLDGSCHFVVDEVSVDVWHLMHSRENRQQFVLPWEDGKES
jgi:hypothetical protein